MAKPTKRTSAINAVEEEDHRGAHLPAVKEQAGDSIGGFDERVFQEAEKTLLIPLADPYRRIIRNCEINLATLQRMNIHAIQRDLVMLVAEILRQRKFRIDGRLSHASRARTLITEYCTALRDWEMMVEASSTAEEDPFRITTHSQMSADLMQEAGIFRLPLRFKGLTLPVQRAMPLDRHRSVKLPGVTSRKAYNENEQVQQIMARFCWGVGGGIALIAPMLLMALHRTLFTTLLTTAVSVVLFAFAVAVISGGIIPGSKPIDLGPRDVLAATGTYAAVLVVFVGGSITSF